VIAATQGGQMKKKSFLAIALTFVFMENANALFEARLNYGFLASKPDLKEVYTGAASDVPAAAANYGLGADAIFVIPIVGIGAGLRYENLGFKAESNGLEYKSSATRTALIVNYRIIDTLLFLGPIATYGISHSNNMKWSLAGTTADLTPESSTSYSIGLEAGTTLLGFLVGAEAGMQTFKWNKMKDANNILTTTPDLDMSGFYMKVLLGFAI
jgi:hypothetical protein